LKERDDWKRRGGTIRQVSTALTVSGLIVGGPLGFGAVGYFLGGRFGHPYSATLAGVFLGFAFAVHQVLKIVRELSR
jgi:hypothetical protein